MVFCSVGRLWRVEVGIAAEESEQSVSGSPNAVQELETLLQVRTAAIRP